MPAPAQGFKTLVERPPACSGIGRARTVDGHDEQALDAAVRELWDDASGRPKALVATTVKGKGVPFMENENRWHYTRLDERTLADALAALEPTGEHA